MKRRLFKLAIFLLLGATINVGVAWGFSIWGRNFDSTSISQFVQTTDSDIKWLRELGWLRAQDTEKLKNNEEVFVERYDGLTLRLFLELPVEKQPYGNTMVPFWIFAIRIHSGWPMHCMEGAFIHKKALEPRYAGSIRHFEGIDFVNPFSTNNDSPLYNQTKALGAILQSNHSALGLRDDSSLLPLKPILTGFSINTIFYSAILWLLTLGPFTARRMIRRKRGLCRKCGYDLRGMNHDKCPECGWGREAEG